MRSRKVLLALALAAGVVGAAAYAYEVARPHVHPIKAADALKYADQAPPAADLP